MDAQLRLSVRHEMGLGDSAHLANQIFEEASRIPQIRVEPQVRAPQPGERAVDVPLAGQLILSFLGGGAAKALLNLLAAWLPKRGATIVELEVPDGTRLTISGSNLSPEVMADLVNQLRRFEPPGHG